MKIMMMLALCFLLYGTPGYMCPEIYCDSSEDIVYTETVDIFSLGVVIINLLLFKE